MPLLLLLVQIFVYRSVEQVRFLQNCGNKIQNVANIAFHHTALSGRASEVEREKYSLRQ